MIRDPQIKDIPQMTALTKEIYGEFMERSGMPINSDNLKITVEAFVKTKSCLVVERNNKVVGIAAWHLSPHLANFSCRVFQEVLYCMKSNYATDALLLLGALEKKAEELKANVIIMVDLSTNETLRRIYYKRGFEYQETYYLKKLGGI